MPDAAFDLGAFRKFTLWMAFLFAALSALPALLALLLTPPGSQWLGAPYNTDDHMVYAAWMRQAQDLHFFFDNRFTTDPQPGLTIHFYFFVLGLISKLVGITGAMLLAKTVLAGAFVLLVGRFVEFLNTSIFAAKLSLFLACAGGGIGFLMWRNFGVAYTGPGETLTLGGLPIDVWQPEASAFPSMLTNGLFMAALCLIMATLLAVLRARERWAPAFWGALAFGLLMNIHSYDVLLVAMVLLGFGAMSLVVEPHRAVAGWSIRVLVIGLGAVPAALWFMHVLAEDPVFRARAATETFSPNFRQVLAGIFPAQLLALSGEAKDSWGSPRRLAGLGVLMMGLGIGFGFADPHTDRYWLGIPAFLASLALGLVALCLMAGPRPARNLLWAWAVLGLVAPYLPGLYQRKLLMGIEIPWAILAGLGAWSILEGRERGKRNLAGALITVVLAATSLRWVSRELMLTRNNVSNTTVHAVYLGPDERKIVELLNAESGKKVVLAMPGVPGRTEDPDVFLTPYLPDLNPIVSGMTGAYTYAGHWSETPNYTRRRQEVAALFLRGLSTPESRARLFATSGATFVIAPEPTAFPEAELADLSEIGEVLYKGNRFSLIRIIAKS